jgi:hypothetical protein
MISDYVMQQQDAQGLRAATDSIALANYTLDCHPAARLAVNGVSTWEGSIGTSVPQPYPVSYRSIVPSAGQCANLLCTFALSASHVGFASVRMEPVFMMISQSAGTAAAFAIDGQVPVQQVNYLELAAQLVADKQILNWGSVSSVGTNGIILTVTNSGGVTASTGWSAGANAGGWPLPNGPYWTDGNSGKGNKWVRFAPTLATNGYYDVYIWWVYAANRTINAPVTIVSANATNTVFINQQINCTNWFKIASSNYFNAGSGGSVTISNLNTSGYVIANAVRWMPLGSIAPVTAPVVEIVASDGAAGEFGPRQGRFTIVCPGGANTAPLTVNYSMGGTATPGVDYAPLPGSVTIPAGAIATNFQVLPLGNSLTTNQVTVTLKLEASANYTLGSLTSATVVIQDWPINQWLRANFTPAQLANPAISGEAADPANDRLPNLMKYALGLNPNAAEPNPFLPAVSNGMFTVAYPVAIYAPDVALTFDLSTNLIDWAPGSADFQQISTTYLGTNQIITIGARTATPLGFIRFQAARR